MSAPTGPRRRGAVRIGQTSAVSDQGVPERSESDPDDGLPAEPDDQLPAEPADTEAAAPERPRWLLPLLGAGIVALVVANNFGNAAWASWINKHPLGLISLNASNKYLIGTTPNTAFLEVLVVGTLRLMAPDPLFYALGYLYRERAVHWARRVFPTSGGLFDALETEQGSFARILDALVFIMPNNPVCLIAGVAGMRFRRFLFLALTGTIGRIILMRLIGTVFEEQILDVLDVVARYQRWLLIISGLSVVGYIAWQLRSHRGLVGGVEDLEEELGD